MTIADAIPQYTTYVDSSTDNSNLWLWFVLLFIDGTGIFGIALYDRKSRTEK